MMHDIALTGVRHDPLAGYLKAVAVLRIVGEQVDPRAAGFWRDDTFVLRSPLDAQALVQFFIERWAPTPLVAPWNGGSGFYSSDQHSGIRTIEASTDDRFSLYRHAIRAAREALASCDPDDKPLLLATLRARLPDDGIRWLDAAVVLGAERPAFPPLLGTGGNDGRLEFSNNQMQRLHELLLTPEDLPTSRAQLAAALLGTPAVLAKDVSIGQFAPGQAGGANMGMGFQRASLINPWDLVLALEGAVAFAASASRALDASHGAAFPFYVRSTPAGYGSASMNEESRGELWMPLWTGAVTAAELAALLAEGRAWVDGRVAESASDFVRSVRQLGVARGIHSFQRFVIAQRNGLAFFASSAGIHDVRDEPEPDPLTPLDHWLRTAERIADRDERCPTSVRQAVHAYQRDLLEPVAGPAGASQLLYALGGLASAVTSSRRHRSLEFVPPMPTMPSGSWPSVAGSNDPVWRLAFLLAQGGLRSDLHPVTDGTRCRWDERTREREVSVDVPVIDRLLRVGARRLLQDPPRYAAQRGNNATLGDVADLLDARLDLAEFGLALDAAVLTRETPPARDDRVEGAGKLPLAVHLCLAALYGPPAFGQPWPLPAHMLNALHRGDGARAVRHAIDHLRARDVPTALPATTLSPDASRRLGVALLLPLSARARRAVWRHVAPLSLASDL